MLGLDALKSLLENVIVEKHKQGYEVSALYKTLKELPDSYDAVFSLEKEVRAAPLREEWVYIEPDDIEGIRKECKKTRNREKSLILSDETVKNKIRAGFLASVCACMLGKPLEEPPYGTLWDIREAAESVGEWPFRGYVSDAFLTAWGRRNPSWVETTQGRVTHVAPDDDITYSICAMLLLENMGVDFRHEDIAQLWIENLPIYTCWGPERTVLLKAGLQSLTPQIMSNQFSWTDSFNPGQEYCGAAIRTDVYGYACPGNPELAAELAWRDASFTHRKTGVYSAMYIAATVALSFEAKSPLDAFEGALDYIPQRSRFHEQMSEALSIVRNSSSFEEAYSILHETFREFGACRIIQELGTVMNTLKYAECVESGIGLQVAQGNDTDSFGCTCGAILGVFHNQIMPKQWIEPFNNCLHTTMGGFYETRLDAVIERMAALPSRLARF